jgi:predicted ATPase/DNA-binding SARP family transcriptional activator
VQPLLTLGDEVAWRGRPLVGDRVQTLLAVLVAHAPDAVSDDRLIDELWGAELPSNPAKALQVVVSRTRSVTDRAVLERGPAGYRLAIPHDAVDVLLVQQLATAAAEHLGAGETAQAATLARTALALPLSHAADTRALELVRGSALRHAASARRTLALATASLGDHRAALPMLVDAIADRPDDEELLAALLASEAATAGPAAALTRYERYRRDLANRLGTDPGPRLTRVYQQLLDADHPVRQGIRHSGTELLGRADDIRQIGALVRTVRVTSIVGAGGLGKTRLAHVIGATAEQSVVHFVELVGVTTPEDVVGEVGSALGVRDSVVGRRALTPAQRADVQSQIAQQLDRTPTLLILDNCEHVIEAAADLVAYLVATCRDVHVLTTSRAPLGIAAEHVYALGELNPQDAADLFRLRARAARPGVALHPESVRAVVARLDGLPLAIELAAAKVRAMSVEDIERRLGDRFALLRGRDRSAPDRHQTLLAVIDWSWNLLAEPERRALRRLSVFHDGFTLDSAEAVVGPGALGSLELLAEQSLLAVRDRVDGVRYRMLETVRDFGRLQLSAADDEADTLAAQRNWAIRMSERAVSRIYGPAQVDAIDEIGREEANLTDVLHRCLSAPDPEGVVALIAGLGGFWAIRGDNPRLITLADAVEAALAGWRPPPELVELTRTALVALVTNSTVVGIETPGALALLLELGPGEEPTFIRAAIRVLIAVYAVDPVDSAQTAVLPGTARRAGSAEARSAEAAETETQDARPAELIVADRLRALGDDPDPLTASLALQWRSHLMENSGDPQAALDDASTALSITVEGQHRSAMGPWGEAMLDTQIAQMNAQLGYFAVAAKHARRAIPVLERLEAIDDLLQAQTLVAMDALLDGRTEDAEAILTSFARYEGASLFGGGVVTRAARAEVALAKGEVSTALRLYDEMADELSRLNVPGLREVTGLEPWTVFGQAVALTAHARHGTAESCLAYAGSVLTKVAALVGGQTPLLDLPVTGMGFFALGVWSLLRGACPAPQAARLLVIADTLAYSRLVPTMAWETAVAEAQERAPGQISHWQTQYAGRRGRDILDDALVALAEAGLRPA